MKSQQTKTYFSPEDVNSSDEARVRALNRWFATKIEAADYPCVGARSALRTDQYRLGVYGAMGSAASSEALAADLKTYIRETIDSNSQYMSMVASFTNNISSEMDFEQKLWRQLEHLHRLDDRPWDSTVSDDPKDNNFSFSFHGTAFFVVGIHPLASRRARRFEFPALVFNLHRQFEQLRDRQVYEKMKQTIRQREVDYDGCINPMLQDHGAGLEAPQYSGRAVDDSWKCPFRK